MARRESDSGLSESYEQREYLQDLELSLVIPLYNETDNVEPLYQAICDSLDLTRYHCHRKSGPMIIGRALDIAWGRWLSFEEVLVV